MLVPRILDNPVGVATVEARVLGARELHPATSPRRTRHLEIALPAGAAYRTGDHLGVCPRNDTADVERLARHLRVSLDGLFTVPKALPVRVVPKGVVVQVRNVLTNLVDIGGKPTVALLDALLRSASDPRNGAGWRRSGRSCARRTGPPSPLRAAIDAGGYDLLRLLDAFPSSALNIFELLCVAQPLRPRYYSVSSCPDIHGCGSAHLTVGLEAVDVPGEPDRTFHGTGSRYLHGLRPGDRLAVFLDSADGFHLQDDISKPMIFVSAGTGIAPMRAFLWERAALHRRGLALGQAALFNGLRSRQLDYLYRRRSRPVRRRRRARSRAHRGIARRSHLRASTSKIAFGVGAPWCGGCCPKAATCTCAAHSRCVKASGRRSSTSSPSTATCRPRAPRRSWPIWKAPDATGPICGPEPVNVTSRTHGECPADNRGSSRWPIGHGDRVQPGQADHVDGQGGHAPWGCRR